MTDNEKLARWQGWGHIVGIGWCSPSADDSKHESLDCPDYLNDDAAAMSLLDTLVEKGFTPQLSGYEDGWWFYIYANDIKARTIAAANKPTRRAAICAAVLEVIGKEDV